MKIKFLIVGKNTEQWVESCINDYANRIKVFCPIEIKYVKESKNTENSTLQLKAEANSILKETKKEDFVVLMDERGKQFTSTGFASQLQTWKDTGKKSIVFIIGGAYGFDKSVTQRADMMVALSSMTFTHQMARVFLAEQLYRAFAIMNRLPYHH
jgi:23S rRNA (pseudouridine1915-N3)-methyltransferase